MPAYVEAEKSVKHKLHSHGVEDEYVVVVPGARWMLRSGHFLTLASYVSAYVNLVKKVVIAGAPDDAEKGAFIEN